MKYRVIETEATGEHKGFGRIPQSNTTLSKGGHFKTFKKTN